MGRKAGHWYYTRFEEGQSYPRYCRAPYTSSSSLTPFEGGGDDDDDDGPYPPPINEGWDNMIADIPTNGNDGIGSDGTTRCYGPLLPNEEVYLDVPSLSRNKKYLATGAIAISPNLR